MEDTGYSFSRKIIRNTAYNACGRLWVGLVSVALTPYIVHHIGIERFGLWAIVGVITGYFGLLDLGVGTSFVKYIAQYSAAGDDDSLSRVLSTGTVFYLAFAVGLIVLAYFVVIPLGAFFKISSSLALEAVIVLWMGIVIFAGSAVGSVFTSFPLGVQRMDISYKLAFALSLVNIAGTIFFLKSGWGLPGLMINNTVLVVLNSLLSMAIMRRLAPAVRLSFALVDRKMLGQLLGFGYKLQVSRFANLVSFQADRLIISFFLGVPLVAFYQLGTSVLGYIRQLPLLLISALIPAVSEMDAKHQHDMLKELYIRGSGYLVALSVGFLFFLVITAADIMFIWMGLGYERAAWVIRVLALGYCAATVTGVASSIAAGCGRTDLDMKFGMLMAAMNLALSILLALLIGFKGVVFATSFSLTAASVYFVHIFHRQLLRISQAEFYGLFLRPLTAGLVAGAFLFIPRYLHAQPITGLTRFESLIVFGVEAVLFSLVYLIALVRLGYFDAYDRGLIRSRLRWA